jgi:hypothetical protein
VSASNMAAASAMAFIVVFDRLLLAGVALLLL